MRVIIFRHIKPWKLFIILLFIVICLQIQFRRSKEIGKLQSKEMRELKFKEMGELQPKEMGKLQTNEMKGLQSKDTGGLKFKKMGELQFKEMRGLQSKEMGKLQSNEMGELKFKKMGELQSKDIGELQSKEMGELQFKEMGELQSKDMGKLQSKEMGELQSKEMEGLKLKKMGELQFKEMGELQSKDIRELQSKEMGELQSKEMGELQSKEMRKLQSKKMGELQSKDIGELQSKEMGELQSKEMRKLQSKKMGELQSKDIGELQSKEMGELQSKEMGELQSKEMEEYERVNTVLLEIRNQLQNQFRLDKSGMYYLIPNLLIAKSRSQRNSENITIATQCSSNNLHYLVEMTERWEGPVSVSVFTYDTDIEFTMKSLAYYHVCNRRIHRSVTFHVVFPINRAPLTDDQQIIEPFDCSSPPVRLSSRPNKNYEIPGLEYPNNLLRNQAINYTRTTHVLTLDGDIMPSDNLGDVFRQIQHKVTFQRNTQVAYVIPVFELKNGHKMPHDKQELLKMWDKKLVRPFHIKTCQDCHKHTNYARWWHTTSGNTYRAQFRNPYEPYYIVEKSVPLFDERFKQYCYDRFSQVCEMYVAGYQFTVLSDVFLIHKGFKLPGHFHKSRSKEFQKNTPIFNDFVKILRKKYKYSRRRC